MNKRIIFVAVLFLALVGGGVAYLLQTDDAQQAKNEMTGSNQGEASQAPSANSQSAGGTYVEYSDAVIANTSGTKLLFFYAPWCPQCRALETDIMAKGVPDGVTIIKTDYDTNQELRKKYGVTLQTTFVKVDDSGNLIEKYVAYDSPTLDAVKTNLL